jgi:Zn-dependent M28 family amino/carboxypeptidase
VLLKHLKSLSSDAFEGRRTGSQGALKARKFIINQFHSLGVKPLLNDFNQLFSFFENRKQYQGVNVLGFINGSEFSDKCIVISAHYDHQGIHNGDIFNGADDNASGVSALIAFADYFKNNPPKHSIILAAFDAEELGLQGSNYFLKNSRFFSSKKIVLNVNMDMISRSDEKELFVCGASYTKILKEVVDNFKDLPEIKLISGHDGYDGLDNWTYSSDHANFYKTGIPFLYFGVENHKDYHEPTDTYENIHPKFYIEAVKTIISVFREIDMLQI